MMDTLCSAGSSSHDLTYCQGCIREAGRGCFRTALNDKLAFYLLFIEKSCSN